MIWLIGNLERTNQCDWLSPSLFSFLGATLPSGRRELSGGLGRGRAGWEVAMVQAAVTAVQYWKVYLLADTSYVLSISLIKVSL